MIKNSLSSLIRRLAVGPLDPDRPLIPGRVNYGQVYRMAAHIVAELNHVPLVCLCTHDKAIVTAALIAALAGGPQLVLPPGLSLPVLEALQSATGYKFAITDSATPLPDFAQRFEPDPTGPMWPPKDIRSSIDPDAPWVKVYTGGSTGAPQCWKKSVRNLLSETQRIVHSYGFCAEDGLVSTVSPLHIYGLLYSVLTPWIAEAWVTEATPSFPAEIADAIITAQATVLVSVPAHYRALRVYEGPVLPLRLAFSSAGVLASEDALAFSQGNRIGVTEVYGSTETGGVASRNRFAEQTDFTAFDSVQVKIVNHHLWVRSDYLSPDLSTDPEGFYRIGDRAQFCGPRCFQLLGRSDSVVKVAGRRVDLEGIRQTLLRYAGVEEAVVASLPVGRAREQLIVALVEGSIDPSRLNPQLNPEMASAIDPGNWPRRIKVVEKMPFTSAGKLDHSTLTALFTEDEGSL